MNSIPTNDKLRARRRRLAWILPFLILLAVGGGMAAHRTRARAAARDVGPTAAVQRGPLTISLVESGSIRNRERIVVRSEVEGRNTLIWLIEEGARVNQGDLLIELDYSQLEEQRLEQEIRVQNSEAAMIQAREGLEVTRNQTTADIASAELDLRFAQLDLEKYREGEYPRELQQAEASITMADEELQRALDNLEWSRQLATEGYITRSELQADELVLKRRQLDLELAQSQLNLLTEYTHTQRLEKLVSDIEQAEMALERIRRRALADIIRAEADLRARQAEYERQKARLERLKEQIQKCRITAPAGGMVVYATSTSTRRWGRTEPLEVGQDIRERQELIHLPASDEMMVEILVQEASLTKIREGMPARITLDTRPDRIYTGRLHRIGVLPDSSMAWLNPDLKLYNCEVLILDTAHDLRPGTSAQVELVIEEHADVLFIPLQSMVRVNGRTTVYTVTPQGVVQPREVRVGLDNGRMLHVLEGLAEGEQVLLQPPLAPSERRDAPQAADPDQETREGPAPAGALQTDNAAREPAPTTGEASRERRPAAADEGEREAGRGRGQRPAGTSRGPDS